MIDKSIQHSLMNKIVNATVFKPYFGVGDRVFFRDSCSLTSKKLSGIVEDIIQVNGSNFYRNYSLLGESFVSYNGCDIFDQEYYFFKVRAGDGSLFFVQNHPKLILKNQQFSDDLSALDLNNEDIYYWKIKNCYDYPIWTGLCRIIGSGYFYEEGEMRKCLEYNFPQDLYVKNDFPIFNTNLFYRVEDLDPRIPEGVRTFWISSYDLELADQWTIEYFIQEKYHEIGSIGCTELDEDGEVFFDQLLSAVRHGSMNCLDRYFPNEVVNLYSEKTSDHLPITANGRPVSGSVVMEVSHASVVFKRDVETLRYLINLSDFTDTKIDWGGILPCSYADIAFVTPIDDQYVMDEYISKFDPYIYVINHYAIEARCEHSLFRHTELPLIDGDVVILDIPRVFNI